MTTAESPKKLSPLFLAVFLVFGAVTVVLAVQTAMLWQVKQSWPRVTGVVVKTDRKGWWDEKEQRRYYLQYRYEVRGKSYTSSRLHLKERSLKRFTHLIRHYQKGDPISVWHHPRDPAEAVINTDYLSASFGLILVLVGFLFLAGTMLLKERRWQRWITLLNSALPADYEGRQPLPESSVVREREGQLMLKTGMSVFWSRGVPFLFTTFLVLFVMMLLMDEINPGWTLTDYLLILLGGWAAALVAGGVFKAAFDRTLEVDPSRQQVTETATVLFRRRITVYPFRDILGLNLQQASWSVTNTLKNWQLYLETGDGRSIFVSYRHRDLQPAQKCYLEKVKARLAHLLQNSAGGSR